VRKMSFVKREGEKFESLRSILTPKVDATDHVIMSCALGKYNRGYSLRISDCSF